MRFTIRRTTTADAKEIADVLRKSFEEYEPIFDPPSGACQETEQSVLRKLSKSTGFVAIGDGHIVGSVLCHPDGDDYFLYRLAVLPEWRKDGIGRALVHAVEEQAVSEGFDMVRLNTRLIVPKNICFYESLGYGHICNAPHSSCDRPTFAVMVKMLDDGSGSKYNQ